jgi:hypothetical protein
MKDWIQTYTGRQFWPLAPRMGDVHIVDIAHHLAGIRRYTNATNRPYSVGEHCCHIARQLLLDYGSRELARAGLLHDASEAYTNDMARPLKIQDQMRPFREMERGIQECIYQRYGLPAVEDPRVRIADMRMYATEVRDLMQPQHHEWRITEQPYGFEVKSPWTEQHTRGHFLRMFYDLGGGSHDRVHV